MARYIIVKGMFSSHKKNEMLVVANIPMRFSLRKSELMLDTSIVVQIKVVNFEELYSNVMLCVLNSQWLHVHTYNNIIIYNANFRRGRGGTACRGGGGGTACRGGEGGVGGNAMVPSP